MNRFFKIAVLAAAGAAILLTSFEFASAGGRYYWRNGHRGYYHNGNWVAAGVLGGLAAGVIVGSALAEPEVVYERPRRVVVDEDPVYVEREYVEPDVEYVAPDDDYDARPVDRYTRESNEDYFPDRPQSRRSSDYAARGTIEPWTAEWRAYCSERYQSFNSRTGTYTGYDGQQHFCTSG